MQRFSVLDTKPSHVLDFPLTVHQQLWLLFLLPALSLLVIYVLDIATDITVGVQLIREGKYILGAITLFLILIPPFISYFIRLASPPDTKRVKIIVAWISVETTSLVLFPVRPIQCIAERIFWSIEAIRLEDPDREEALVEYEATRATLIENQLFTQAFLQAAPQALFQSILLAIGTSNDRHTEVMQAVCVLSSLATLALIASSYQRYETQVRGGRHQVWTSHDRSFSSLLQAVGEEGQRTPEQSQRWVKVMEEDNPLGSVILFMFWFLFLVGRILCFVLAGLFFPWTVLIVCAVHYLFALIYILPSPDCKSEIPAKIALALIFILCLVEVRVQFRKSCILYSLFFTFSILENISLTLLWGLWANWSGFWYVYFLYIIGVTHAVAIFLLFVYMKCLKPSVKRLAPM